MNQRWRLGRDHYRPPREVINPRLYEVEEIPDDTTAKAFIVRHHYEHSFPAARFRFALHRKGTLAGVAVFSHPMNDRVLTSVFPGDAKESVELGRFVLLDQVPGNGETWFLARAFRVLKRKGIIGVLSHSDPLPRRSSKGHVVKPGHIGTIYQAKSGRFIGRASPRTEYLLPDGTVFSRRALQKIRNQEQGWRYASKILVRHGAEPLGAGEDPRTWLELWLPRLTRRRRHPGNFKYVWPLDRRIRRDLPKALPYPKQSA